MCVNVIENYEREISKWNIYIKQINIYVCIMQVTYAKICVIKKCCESCLPLFTSVLVLLKYDIYKYIKILNNYVPDDFMPC